VKVVQQPGAGHCSCLSIGDGARNGGRCDCLWRSCRRGILAGRPRGSISVVPCGRCDACHNKHYARCRSYDYYGSRRHGGFAQYLNVKIWNLLPLPRNLDFDNAALVEPVAVVLHALDRAGVLTTPNASTNGEIVIVGAGFLSLVAAQMLHLLHPAVVVTLIDRNAY